MRLLSFAFVIGSTTIALAQPAAPTGAPSEAPPPPEAPPAPPAPPAEPPAPTVEVTPPKVVEVVPVDKLKEEKQKRAVTAEYDGGLKFATADKAYALKLLFREQVRFEANRSLRTETPTRHNQFTDRFFIPRSRFQASGNVFGESNRFKVELVLGDAGSLSFIKDLFIEKKLPGSPVRVRVGQFKRPFNRPWLTSAFSQQFNERSIQNDMTGSDRDLGVLLHNDYEVSPAGLEWAAGVFNGFTGGNDRPTWKTTCTQAATTGAITCTNSNPTTFPTDFGPTFVARVGYNSPKMKGYSESDLEGGPLRYAVGASYKIDLANFSKRDEESVVDNMSTGAELDAMIKVEGFSLGTGLLRMKLKTADAEYGFFVQPGMMVVPKHAEVAGRFALVTVGDRKRIEGRAAFNWFVQGHMLKIASDAGFVQLLGSDPMTMMKDKPELQFRVMMQLQI